MNPIWAALAGIALLLLKDIFGAREAKRDAQRREAKLDEIKYQGAEIHVMVNSRLSAALAEIRRLRKLLSIEVPLIPKIPSRQKKSTRLTKSGVSWESKSPKN